MSINRISTDDSTQTYAAGGCWAPGSMVLMADGTRKAIELIEPDDRVWTATGDATVEYTLKLGMYETPMQWMCRVGQLHITWYHPVKVNNTWVAPCSLVEAKKTKMPVVHNLIVSNCHVLDIDGILTISLGHESREEGLAHEFFGSKERIMDAIRDQPGFNERRVVYEQLAAVRRNNVVVDWIDIPTTFRGSVGIIQ